MLVDTSDEDAMAKARAGGDGPLEEQVTNQGLQPKQECWSNKETGENYIGIQNSFVCWLYGYPVYVMTDDGMCGET